jgi:2-C-methyl-D-erythritol 4-phosphate cytidylyltransferase
VTDTIKRGSAESRVLATVDRRDLWRAQTPQMFRVGELADALAHGGAGAWRRDHRRGVGDGAGRGFPVLLVPGSAANLKVTYPATWRLQLSGWQQVRVNTPATQEQR